MFKLLDYAERLKVTRESASQLRFICPVCEHNTLTLNKSSNAYQCWGGCTTSQIRELLGAVAGTSIKRTKVSKSLMVEVKPRKLQLKQVTDYRLTTSEYTNHLQTYYEYAEDKRVIGHRWGTKGTSGYRKDFFPYVKRRGRWKIGRADSGIWPPYRWAEVLSGTSGNAVLFVEGEACADAVVYVGLCAITVQQWSRIEIQYAIRLCKEQDLSIVYVADNDLAGLKKQEMVCELAQQEGVYAKTISVLDFDPDLLQGGDIKDLLDRNSTYALQRLLAMTDAPQEMQVEVEVEIEAKSGGGGVDRNATNYCLWNLKGNLIWNPSTQLWMYYEGGKYVIKPPEFIRKRIMTILGQTDYELSKQLLESIIYMLQGELVLLKANLHRSVRYAVFTNATVDLNTMKIVKHNPTHNALTGAHFAIEQSKRTDGGIIASWLAEHMAEENLVWLRAFINCMIRGDTHYEKYLELVGPGGSGKSTFTRILDLIIGSEGVLVSALTALDKDKFEIACLHGKRLLLMPDQERYQGNYSVLKAITGHDRLRYEVKGLQRSNNDFYANVFVVCTANEPLNGSDLSSGILRRRRVIGMSRVNITCDNLLDSNGTGALAPGLVDFWWWCALMPLKEVDAEMTKQLVMDESLTDSPLVGWALHGLERTANTINHRVTMKELHRDYVKWCKQAAVEALHFARFRHLIMDTLQHQLTWDVFTGAANSEPFVQGIKIKDIIAGTVLEP